MNGPAATTRGHRFLRSIQFVDGRAGVLIATASAPPLNLVLYQVVMILAPMPPCAILIAPSCRPKLTSAKFCRVKCKFYIVAAGKVKVRCISIPSTSRRIAFCPFLCLCTCYFPRLFFGRVGALAIEHLLLASARAGDPRRPQPHPNVLAETPPGLTSHELAQLMKDDPARWEGLLR